MRGRADHGGCDLAPPRTEGNPSVPGTGTGSARAGLPPLDEIGRIADRDRGVVVDEQILERGAAPGGHPCEPRKKGRQVYSIFHSDSKNA